MIVYRSKGLRIAELWFDEPDRDIAADVIRYRQALTAPTGAAWTPFFTLVLDLTKSDEDLFAGMTKETQYKIRRASQKDLVGCGSSDLPDARLLARFRAIYDPFAREHDLPLLDWDHVQRLAAARQLEISLASVEGVGDLVFHSYVKVRNRVRLLHSVSLSNGRNDESGYRNLRGRANRLLHWYDIQRFKARALETYDLGGWYEGSVDSKKLQINTFKEAFGGHLEKDYNGERLVTARARFASVAARLLRPARAHLR